jgi:hypothetical protein
MEPEGTTYGLRSPTPNAPLVVAPHEYTRPSSVGHDKLRVKWTCIKHCAFGQVGANIE